MRTAIGLIVCYVIGAILAAVLATAVGLSIATSGSAPPDPPRTFAAVFLNGYLVATVIAGLTMIRASARAVGLFAIGAASACLTAAAAGRYLGANYRELSDPFFLSVVPIVVSSVVTTIVAFWTPLFATSGEVAAGLATRAAGGRSAVAASSLATTLLGYFWIASAPGAESTLIAFIANSVGLFLGIRSLPNVMAIVGVGSSTAFLLYVLLRPAYGW